MCHLFLASTLADVENGVRTWGLILQNIMRGKWLTIYMVRTSYKLILIMIILFRQNDWLLNTLQYCTESIRVALNHHPLLLFWPVSNSGQAKRWAGDHETAQLACVQTECLTLCFLLSTWKYGMTYPEYMSDTLQGTLSKWRKGTMPVKNVRWSI